MASPGLFWTIFGLGKYLLSVSYSKIMQGIRIWPSQLSKIEFWSDFFKSAVIRDGNIPFLTIFGLVIYLLSVCYCKIMKGIRIWPSELSNNEFWQLFFKSAVIRDGNSPFWTIFGLIIYLLSVSYCKMMQGIRIWPKIAHWSGFWAVFGLVIY